MKKNFSNSKLSLIKAQTNFKSASREDDFQMIGLLCREALITLAQYLYNPEIHKSSDDIKISNTDTKRMLEAYVLSEISGKKYKILRKFMRATIDLSLELQHKRSAINKDAEHCILATQSVFDHLAIIKGEDNNTEEKGIEVNVSFERPYVRTLEHNYQLEIEIINNTENTISKYRLDLAFPDLDKTPRQREVYGKSQDKNKKLVIIEPTDPEVSVKLRGLLYEISINSLKPIFPGDSIKLGNLINLKYVFNQEVYSNLSIFLPVTWTLYSDGSQPLNGKKLLSELNIF